MSRSFSSLSAPTAAERFTALMRRWLMLMLALAYIAIIILLAASGPDLALRTGDGLAQDGATALWSIAFFIHIPIALSYLGASLLALHPRYHDDVLFSRIGWLVAIGLGLACARMTLASVNMDWLLVPLSFASLLFLGRALAIVAWWPRPISSARRLLINLPLGLQAGWLTLLAPFNVLSLMSPGDGAEAVSLTGGFLALVAVLALGVAGVRVTRGEPYYVLALIWGLAAIGLREGVPTLDAPLRLLAVFAALVIVAMALWTGAQRRPIIFG